MMKRIFALLLCAATLLASLSFVGCDMSSNNKKKEKQLEKLKKKDPEAYAAYLERQEEKAKAKAELKAIKEAQE